jgi:hypothetical protein
MKILDHVPTKSVPDWVAVAALVAEHGAVLLPLKDFPNPQAAKANLHRYGVGLYRAQDVAGVQVGWRAAPLRRGSKRRASEELT